MLEKKSETGVFFFFKGRWIEKTRLRWSMIVFGDCKKIYQHFSGVQCFSGNDIFFRGHQNLRENIFPQSPSTKLKLYPGIF